MAQARKFSFTDIMNSSAKGAGEDKPQGYGEIFLSPYEVFPTESNFYSQENIEELADAFLAVGQQQPTVLALIDGVYRIVSGHRRNNANIYNIERGELPTDTKVRYLYKEMTPAMLELSLLMGNALNRKLTPYEEAEQASRLRVALLRAKEEDGLELTGKMRDIIADLLETSPTQIARMDKINSSLTPEAKEQFRAGNLGITAAYEVAKLPEEEQQAVAQAAATGEEVKPKDIVDIVQERKKAALDKAIKQAEDAEVRLLQATVHAERAIEVADMTAEHAKKSETDTRADSVEKEKALENLKKLLPLIDFITAEENEILQEIAKAAAYRGRVKNG